ncbi:hypothetical protein TNCV_899571 [Trichonephila clavipes]|nr:hypothetical protein TNCV_899571 [Trichonephila clavipes]
MIVAMFLCVSPTWSEVQSSLIYRAPSYAKTWNHRSGHHHMQYAYDYAYACWPLPVCVQVTMTSYRYLENALKKVDTPVSSGIIQCSFLNE